MLPIYAKIKKSPTFLCKALNIRWEQTDSNRRPSACKADALNQLSYAPICIFAGAKIIMGFDSAKIFFHYVLAEYNFFYNIRNI